MGRRPSAWVGLHPEASRGLGSQCWVAEGQEQWQPLGEVCFGWSLCEAPGPYISRRRGYQRAEAPWAEVRRCLLFTHFCALSLPLSARVLPQPYAEAPRSGLPTEQRLQLGCDGKKPMTVSTVKQLYECPSSGPQPRVFLMAHNQQPAKLGLGPPPGPRTGREGLPGQGALGPLAAWPEKVAPGQQGILAIEEQVPRTKDGGPPPPRIPTWGGR